MTRVPLADLDPQAPGDELGFATVGGEPFTGVVVEAWPGGELNAETEYAAGLRTGPQRRYHPAGGPASAAFYAAGIPHGVYRKWHANGRLREAGVVEYGVAVRSRRWDENGRLTKDTDVRAARQGLVAAGRAEHAAAVDAVPLPAEFRPPAPELA